LAARWWIVDSPKALPSQRRRKLRAPEDTHKAPQLVSSRELFKPTKREATKYLKKVPVHRFALSTPGGSATPLPPLPQGNSTLCHSTAPCPATLHPAMCQEACCPTQADSILHYTVGTRKPTTPCSQRLHTLHHAEGPCSHVASELECEHLQWRREC
jgi:hypothetical protein